MPDEDDENAKEMLLSLYTGKSVYILIGDIWLPGEPNSYEGWRYNPPNIYSYHKGKTLGSDPTIEIEASPMVKVILQKLDKSSITAMVQHGNLAMHTKEILPLDSLSESIQVYLDLLLQQHECISALAPLIEQYSEELVTALTPQKGWEIEFFPQDLSWTTCGWAECSACGNISFSFLFREKDMDHHECPYKGTYKINTPGLLKAYRAASTSAI